MDVMKFTQAISRIWVLETRLLDKAKVERMIEASSASEVLRILNETEYANVSANVKRAEDYEEILSAELKRVYDLVYEISPIKEVVKIMNLKYDYHNAKVLLKEKVLGKDLSSMLIKLGNIDLQEIKRKIDSDNLKSLNGTLGKGIQEAMKSFEETKDPQKIDIIIDKYMFKELVEINKSLNYKFIDMDQDIEVKACMFIDEIFDLYGEAYFRALEKNTLKDYQKAISYFMKLPNDSRCLEQLGYCYFC